MRVGEPSTIFTQSLRINLLTHKKLVPTIAAVFLVAGLSACTPTSDGGPANDPNATKTVTTQKATTDKPVASNPGKGIIGATTMSSCGTDAGTVVAEGTVTPPEDAPGKVVISVSWVQSETSSVLAKGSQTFDSPAPGKTLEWSISSTLKEGVKDVKCVLGARVLP